MMAACSCFVSARRLAFATRFPPLATGISALTAVLAVPIAAKNGDCPMVFGFAGTGGEALVGARACTCRRARSAWAGGTAALTAGGNGGGGAFGVFFFPIVLPLFLSSGAGPRRHSNCTHRG